MKKLWLSALLLFIPVIAARNAAPTVNVAGVWQANFLMNGLCALHDTMTIVQSGTHFSGTISGKLWCTASFNTAQEVNRQVNDSITNGIINGNVMSFDLKPITIDSLDFLLAHQQGTIGDGLNGTFTWILRGGSNPVIYPIGGTWTALQP